MFFLLVYRLGESQLVKLASPFLLDSKEANGLGLTTGDLGLIYGTIGIIALSLGGIIGGIAASRQGSEILALVDGGSHEPAQPGLCIPILCDALLTLGGRCIRGRGTIWIWIWLYGLYALHDLCIGREAQNSPFCADHRFYGTGNDDPGDGISGWLQELIGYQHFFIWVMICTIPSFIVIPFLKIDPRFGKKEI